MGSISDTDTLYPTMLLLINKSEKTNKPRDGATKKGSFQKFRIKSMGIKGVLFSFEERKKEINSH